MTFALSNGEVSAASNPDRASNSRLLGFGFARLCRIVDEEMIAEGQVFEISNPFPRKIEGGTFLELEQREGGGFLVKQILI